MGELSLSERSAIESLFLSVFGWGNALQLFELLTEMVFVVKAKVVCNLLHLDVGEHIKIRNGLLDLEI